MNDIINIVRKFDIILDMDEVLADTFKSWLREYNRDYNDSVVKEDIKGWNPHVWIKPECGKDVYKYLKKENFFLNMDPIQGAAAGVRKLLEDGHEVFVGTATPTGAYLGYGEKIEWLKKWIPEIPLDNFISVHRKEMIRGDILLDDGAHNLSDFRGISVCMRRPWNRGEKCFEHSVNDWPEFISLVNRLSTDLDFRLDTIQKKNNRILSILNKVKEVKQWNC